LEGKIPNSELWASLMSLGYSEEKIADLKIKAYRVSGKAEMKRGNLDDAKQQFEAALKLSRNETVTKELDDLLLEVVKKRSSEKKKEQALWQKAFSKRDLEVEEGDTDKKSPTKPRAASKTVPKDEGVVAKPSSFSFSPIFGFGVLATLMAGAAFFWMRRRH